MTKKEHTGIRDLYFSQWIRTKLPDSSTGFAVSDIDFILWNWKNKTVMILEIKSMSAAVPKFQKIMWQNIHNWIKKGITPDWKYLGFHLVTFEETQFDNGKCFLDKEEISEDNLITFLSMTQ